MKDLALRPFHITVVICAFLNIKETLNSRGVDSTISKRMAISSSKETFKRSFRNYASRLKETLVLNLNGGISECCEKLYELYKGHILKAKL